MFEFCQQRKTGKNYNILSNISYHRKHGISAKREPQGIVNFSNAVTLMPQAYNTAVRALCASF